MCKRVLSYAWLCLLEDPYKPLFQYYITVLCFRKVFYIPWSVDPRQHLLLLTVSTTVHEGSVFLWAHNSHRMASSPPSGPATARLLPQRKGQEEDRMNGLWKPEIVDLSVIDHSTSATMSP